MKSTAAPRLALYLLLCLVSANALAEKRSAPADEKSVETALNTLLPLAAFVDAGWLYCSEKVPQQKQAIAEAISNWRLVNGISAISDLIASSAKTNSSMAALYKRTRDKQAVKLYRKIGDRIESWCNGLPRLLAKPQWQLQARFPDQLATVRQMARRLGKTKPLPPSRSLALITTPTLKQLRQARINPESQLIPDAFRCYREKPGSDYLWPDMIIQIPTKGVYQSSFGNGRYQMLQKKTVQKIRWQTGPLEGRESHLRYDRYGQRFELSSRIQDQHYKFHCFQRGASEQHALASYRLRDPQPGNYQCRDLKSGKQQTLRLAADLNYRLGSARGSYRVEEIIGKPGESSSRIIWVSGPLAEEGKNKKARYSEEEGTGLRTLRISTTWNRFVMGTGGSSSKLSAICTASGEPIHFQKYGASQAPAPPPEAGGLEGFYYTMENRFGYWNQESADAPRYYSFFSGGYLYKGEPEGDPGNTDCSRTLPNGAPLCVTYFITDGYIRIGQEKAQPFRHTKKILHIGDKQYVPVPKPAINRLDGQFSHSSFSKWGTMDWGGSSYQKTIFTFTPEGRFSQQNEGQTNHAFDAGPTGMNIPGASIYGIGSHQDSNSGTYSIEGHTITFHYNDGRVLRHFAWVKDRDHLYMMNKAFVRSRERQK